MFFSLGTEHGVLQKSPTCEDFTNSLTLHNSHLKGFYYELWLIKYNCIFFVCLCICLNRTHFLKLGFQKAPCPAYLKPCFKNSITAFPLISTFK